MPRPLRASAANTCYHVLNRGNARGTVFHKDGDYAAFLKLLAQASQRTPGWHWSTGVHWGAAGVLASAFRPVLAVARRHRSLRARIACRAM